MQNPRQSLLVCAVIFTAVSLFAQSLPQVATDVRHDVSPPLASIHPEREAGPPFEIPLLRIHPHGPATNSPDGALQATAGATVNTSGGFSFDGVGKGFSGPQGTFSVTSAPPDTNGAVGATQYVQWVNTSFAIFDKATGAVVYGPAAGNTIWSGFGGLCQSNNNGDPVVQYDKAHNRWIMTQLAFSSGGPYYQCIAVSTTSDATGTWNRYAYQYTSGLNDYPKLGVWPDGYYMSFNMFQGGATFIGSQACAFDSAAMRAGTTARQVCFQTTSAYGGLLPSDLDGSTPPPAGTPNYYLAYGTNQLQLWKFHVDWTNTANSTFTGPTLINVASFSEACSGGTCVPQSGTTQQLDSLGDRLMYRLAYRQFSDHASLVANHSVTAGSSVGVRWYELRNLDTTPTVYQQSTYAPDSNYRWMGSVAMDKVGNMAMGYSVSSSSMFPSIRYTGRLSTDALSTMEAETAIQAGGGYQYYPGGLSRWGDYSSISIDPSDDCTFWYTTEYLKASGGFNWSTRVYSFSFPSCTGGTITAPAAPTNLTATGGNAQVGLVWTASSGATSYNVYRSTTSGTGYGKVGSSTSASYTDTALSNGTTYYYVVTAVNSGGESGYSNQASATPQASTGSFSLAAASNSMTIARGSSGTDAITVNGLNSYSGTVSFSLSGLPTRTSYSFTPASVTTSNCSASCGTSSLRITANRPAPRGTYSLTVSGNDGANIRTVSITLTIQ